MSPENYVANSLLLPELEFIEVAKKSNRSFYYHCRKCPTKSFKIHDYRQVKIRDARMRSKNIILVIHKRRFRCPNCKCVFTEIIPGIKSGFRTSKRFRDQVLLDVKTFENLKSVSKENLCSSTFVANVANERLDLELRKSKNTPWGKTVLINEHGFMKNKKTGRKDFVTAFVDNNRKCLRELAPGRNHLDLESSIKHIPGKENVSNVVIDMCSTYKNFALNYFPNAPKSLLINFMLSV